MIHIGNLMKQLMLSSSLTILCGGVPLAQAQTELAPIPAGAGSALTPRMESCDDVDCTVSPAQLHALDGARALYVMEKTASATYSAVIGKKGEAIEVTLLPSPFGVRGIAMTYVYTLDGGTLVRSFPNR